MSYIPALTFPPDLFASPIASFALPVCLGIGSGLLSQPGKHSPKTPSDGPSSDIDTYHHSQHKKYAALKQPPFRPPPWIFAPAWTLLYGLMGYASHRAWTAGMASLDPRVLEDTKRGATLYTIQLGLNLCFMPLFYGLAMPVAALADISALTGIVGYLTFIWGKVDTTAGYCLVPYVGWLGFATYLAAGTGYLNDWNFKKEKAAAGKKSS